MKLAAQFRSTDFIFAMQLYLPVWHSHCTTARFTVLGHAVVSLQFTQVNSFPWQNLVANFFGVGLYCATRAAITRQQIFKGSIQVTIVGVYCMLFLNTGATPSDF